MSKLEYSEIKELLDKRVLVETDKMVYSGTLALVSQFKNYIFIEGLYGAIDTDCAWVPIDSILQIELQPSYQEVPGDICSGILPEYLYRDRLRLGADE